MSDIKRTFISCHTVDEPVDVICYEGTWHLRFGTSQTILLDDAGLYELYMAVLPAWIDMTAGKANAGIDTGVQA